jgi:hypothetical protein
MWSARTPLLVVWWSLVLALPLFAATEEAATEEDFTDMNLEELLNVEVSVASKKSSPDGGARDRSSSRKKRSTYGDRTLHQLLSVIRHLRAAASVPPQPGLLPATWPRNSIFMR